MRGRVLRTVRWRSARVTGFVLPPLRMVRELRRATRRPVSSIVGDFVWAKVRLGVRPRQFVASRMWDAPRERWRDFVSDAEIASFFAATIDPQDRLLIRDKAAFADADRQRGMPWLPTLAVVNRHENPPIDAAEVVSEKHALVSTLERLATGGAVFLKPSCGKRGRGAYRYATGGFALDEDGSEVALDVLADSVFAYRHPSGAYGYIVQRALEPHPSIVELTGVSVLATVRVVTAVRDGTVHVLQFALKVPAPGRITDNFQGGMTGTLLAGVDQDSGRVRDLVGILNPKNRLVCERTVTHPATSKRIGGRELPAWSEALELARRSALLHPRTATLGWDIALTPTGWKFLDVNAMWSPSVSQATTGQGLRLVLERLFPEHWSATSS